MKATNHDEQSGFRDIRNRLKILFALESFIPRRHYHLSAACAVPLSIFRRFVFEPKNLGPTTFVISVGRVRQSLRSYVIDAWLLLTVHTSRRTPCRLFIQMGAAFIAHFFPIL